MTSDRAKGSSTPLPLRPLGRTGLQVTPLCVGGGTLGGMPGVATVRRFPEGPINFIDTSANYGDGESERHGVPLAAAALQFSLRSERIASTVVGVSHPERIDQTLRLARWDLPARLWDQLEPLAAPPELWQW
jgi:D-threo-aldose 1-dehydrogenase